MSSSISTFIPSSFTDDEMSFRTSSSSGISSINEPIRSSGAISTMKPCHIFIIWSGVPPEAKLRQTSSSFLKVSSALPFRYLPHARLPSGNAERAAETSRSGDLRRGPARRNVVFSLSHPEVNAFHTAPGNSPRTVPATVPLTCTL